MGFSHLVPEYTPVVEAKSLQDWKRKSLGFQITEPSEPATHLVGMLVLMSESPPSAEDFVDLLRGHVKFLLSALERGDGLDIRIGGPNLAHAVLPEPSLKEFD